MVPEHSLTGVLVTTFCLGKYYTNFLLHLMVPQITAGFYCVVHLVTTNYNRNLGKTKTTFCLFPFITINRPHWGLNSNSWNTGIVR